MYTKKLLLWKAGPRVCTHPHPLPKHLVYDIGANFVSDMTIYIKNYLKIDSPRYIN